MSNQNKELIIAYFPGADKADMAADQLKAWAEDQDEIEFGGMGIITYYDRKLHTRKIGARAAGTGAKWGTILGATGGLLAGIATGGIGFVPGAIAGLGAGALTGAVFHKRLGMTDEDRKRLTNHLEAGGAALGVMADDFEVEATKSFLNDLGGDVEHYTVPEEMVEALSGASEHIEDASGEGYSPVGTAVLEIQVAALMATVRNLDEEDALKLQGAGVHSSDDLLAMASTPQGRQDLADAADIERDIILKWANDLDLARVRGIGAKYADLLEKSGVDTVPELARRNPANLAAKMAEINEELRMVARTPSEEEVGEWVTQAKELPRVMSY